MKATALTADCKGHRFIDLDTAVCQEPDGSHTYDFAMLLDSGRIVLEINHKRNVATAPI
jgi:hypothetical protein